MLGLSLPKHIALTKSVRTVLRRDGDGTVTVISLAAVWRPALSRQPDGTVTIA
jgi:hypothetical protein